MASPFSCAAGLGRILINVTQCAFGGDEAIKVENGKDRETLYCRTSLFVPISRAILVGQPSELGCMMSSFHKLNGRCPHMFTNTYSLFHLRLLISFLNFLSLNQSLTLSSHRFIVA